MTDQVVTYELEGEIALIGLDRPDKRNAMSTQLSEQLRDAVLRAHEEAKVGIVFGNGEHFCAGLDLAELRERLKAKQPLRRRPTGMNGTDLIGRGEIPFIAALKGAVVGGGLELASACQIRVADETAFFALPEGQRGIFVGGGGSVRISRLMTVARMTDMMLTGRVISSAEALEYNVAQYVVPAGTALDKAKELALRIAQNAPRSNYAAASSLARLRELPVDDGLYFERIVATSTFGSDAMERVSAFVEKRADPLKRPSSEKK